jgi:hypothetical protein
VCCELEPLYSKNVVQGFIALGKVFVNGQQVTKAGHQVVVVLKSPQCPFYTNVVVSGVAVCMACVGDKGFPLRS